MISSSCFVLPLCPGSGPILLDDVECSGTETTIEDCLSAGWGENNCGHSEDAGVVCGSSEGRQTMVELKIITIIITIINNNNDSNKTYSTFISTLTVLKAPTRLQYKIPIDTNN